jgi:hypothetical protein
MEAKATEREPHGYSWITLAEFSAYATETAKRVDAGAVSLDEAISEVVMKSEDSDQ